MSLTKKMAVICPLLTASTSVHGFTSPHQNNMQARSDIKICTKSNNNICLHAAKDADMTDEEREIAMEKALKAMTAFSNKYIENTGTRYCMDKSIPAVVIKGLAEHKVKLGTPLCPCRFYEDKEKEAKEGYWNW